MAAAGAGNADAATRTPRSARRDAGVPGAPASADNVGPHLTPADAGLLIGRRPKSLVIVAGHGTNKLAERQLGNGQVWLKFRALFQRDGGEGAPNAPANSTLLAL